MSSSGTDVMGIGVPEMRAVVRCVSSADTSLSLSLSLCSQFLSAENGAQAHLLAGSDRALGRGFSRSRGAA